MRFSTVEKRSSAWQIPGKLKSGFMDTIYCSSELQILQFAIYVDAQENDIYHLH